ncbi:hypothetical protein Pjdr2_1916 [Paenibacillus sp. JDR-2]|nr:hypothetical protein Pjdr2_1916 [Paenibacillus sp. JDR-2]
MDSRRRGAGSRSRRVLHGGDGDNRRVRRGGDGDHRRVRHGAALDLGQDQAVRGWVQVDREVLAAQAAQAAQVAQEVQAARLRDRGLAEINN